MKYLYLVAAIAIEITLGLTLISSDYAAEAASREHELLIESLGLRTAEIVQQQAENWYQTLMIESGAEDALWTIIPTHAEAASSRGLENAFSAFFRFAATRLEAFSDCIFWAFKRAALLAIWVPIMLPVFAMATADGWLRRKVKMQTFAFSSPFVQKVAGHLAFLAGGALLLYFFLPVAMPPAVAPVLLALSAGLIAISVANVRKRL